MHDCPCCGQAVYSVDIDQLCNGCNVYDCDPDITWHCDGYNDHLCDGTNCEAYYA